jgi:hypothetical protein
MAKATVKPSAKAPAKKAPAKASLPANSTAVIIEKAAREALAKLRSLDIEHQLQADIEWCLGSYQADNNPVGLYDMVNRSIEVFKSQLQLKTKGVTSKLISDLGKAVASR